LNFGIFEDVEVCVLQPIEYDSCIIIRKSRETIRSTSRPVRFIEPILRFNGIDEIFNSWKNGEEALQFIRISENIIVEIELETLATRFGTAFGIKIRVESSFGIRFGRIWYVVSVARS
jgi:hypothetical protein